METREELIEEIQKRIEWLIHTDSLSVEMKSELARKVLAIIHDTDRDEEIENGDDAAGDGDKR